MRLARQALGRVGQVVLTMRLGVFILTALVLFGCADSKEVNAAFSRNQVSWMLFDPTSANGTRALSGFAQGVKVTWVPRDEASFVTDAVPLADHRGAVAVSHLGLLILDDSTGTLVPFRPGAQFPLASYETDRVFEWNRRVFLTLRQEFPASQPPASLAWWSTGQERLAFYPIPSQVKDPSRQAVRFEVEPGTLRMTWKVPQAGGWVFDTTTLTLSDGSEASGEQASPPPAPLGKAYDALKLRLSQRLGSAVSAVAAVGEGPLLMFTASGWTAVGKPGETPRLYRLPELGEAGRYTAALALDKGFVFVWEVEYRGYAGAAGAVHVPFAVLAP
jgi:hypothetical protein